MTHEEFRQYLVDKKKYYQKIVDAIDVCLKVYKNYDVKNVRVIKKAIAYEIPDAYEKCRTQSLKILYVLKEIKAGNLNNIKHALSERGDTYTPWVSAILSKLYNEGAVKKIKNPSYKLLFYQINPPDETNS